MLAQKDPVKWCMSSIVVQSSCIDVGAMAIEVNGPFGLGVVVSEPDEDVEANMSDDDEL